MAQIELKFDNQLTQSPIVLPLATPGPDQVDDTNAPKANPNIKQTQLYGVVAPLIKIGDIVVDVPDIVSMTLDGSQTLPRLSLDIIDSTNLIRGLQNPTTDNEVRLQILPRFEDAYKKINLTFYIKRYSADGSMLHFDCIYKIPELYNSRIKCFGEISSYELYETVAKECQLGFASNLQENSNDVRYIYCTNTSYLDIMNKTIESSGDAGNDIQSRVLYDYWVDFWNNINFVDIYERYNTVDVDEDMMIYVSDSSISTNQNTPDDQSYVKVPAIISNHPSKQGSELYISDYETFNRSSKVDRGSDRVISIYNMNDKESLDYMLQDGDQQKDVFVKYEYLGECYRDFNYLLASDCRNMMKDKMLDEVLEVKLSSPTVALQRGSKVDVIWFDTSGSSREKKKQLGIKEEDVQSNIPLPNETTEYAEKNSGPLYQVDKIISGQYYILSSVITYENYQWFNTLRITRPRDTKQQYLDASEDTKNIA